ncbi:MAG: hypothetical protein FWD24_07190 [Treponema sp.]|nr:hypothetical protein [Treponema sp.]
MKINLICFGFLCIVFLLSSVTAFGQNSDGFNNQLTITKDSIRVSNGTVFDPHTGNELTGRTFNGRYVASLTDNFRNPACSINNGRLTINLGRPTTITSLFPDFPVVGDNTVKIAVIHVFANNNSTIVLEKDNKPVSFIYVDKDVIFNGFFEPASTQFNNVTLREGWNTVTNEWNGTRFITTNVTVDSSCRWVLWAQ